MVQGCVDGEMGQLFCTVGARYREYSSFFLSVCDWMVVLDKEDRCADWSVEYKQMLKSYCAENYGRTVVWAELEGAA